MGMHCQLLHSFGPPGDAEYLDHRDFSLDVQRMPCLGKLSEEFAIINEFVIGKMGYACNVYTTEYYDQMMSSELREVELMMSIDLLAPPKNPPPVSDRISEHKLCFICL